MIKSSTEENCNKNFSHVQEIPHKSLVSSKNYFQPKTVIQLNKSTSPTPRVKDEESKRKPLGSKTNTEHSHSSHNHSCKDIQVIEIVTRDGINDTKVKAEIPDSVQKVEVINGESFNPQSLKIDEAIPGTKEFRIYKYKNPKT